MRTVGKPGAGVHVGNFGEIKNSTLADGVKSGHFSYLGDTTVGALTNRQKTQLVDALRPSLPVPVRLATVGLSSSSFFYQGQATSAPDKYASLRTHIADMPVISPTGTGGSGGSCATPT